MTVALSWLNLCFLGYPFSVFARMCWTAVPFRLKSLTGVLHAQPTSGMQIHALSIKKNDS